MRDPGKITQPLRYGAPCPKIEETKPETALFMTLPIKDAQQILTDLGYEIKSWSSNKIRRYFVERGPLAIKYDLPDPELTLGYGERGFDAGAFKAFCFSAVAKAGCTALPTWC